MKKVEDISDGVCAYLTGGLGNQLFIYCAAWEQAVRLDCPLYVDISHFQLPNIRDFDLDTLNLPGTVISDNSPWQGRPLGVGRRRDRIKAKLRNIGSNDVDYKIFREASFNFDPSIYSISVGTTISGYFQSPRYFPNVAGLLRGAFEAVAHTTSEIDEIQSVKASEHLVLHVRRGDYMDEAVRAHHGLASYEYFDRAMRLAIKIDGERTPLIFTDDAVVVKREYADSRGVVVVDPLHRMSTIATLKAMGSGRSMIMSNSSFSWWAAWLMSGQAGSTVIAPRPWFAEGAAAADLLLKDWVTLDARE